MKKKWLVLVIIFLCGMIFAQTSDGILQIPEGITKIGDAQYRNNNEIISIEFSNSVEKIGTMSFRSCNALQSVSIPGTVKVVGDWSFAQNANLIFVDAWFHVKETILKGELFYLHFNVCLICLKLSFAYLYYTA